MEPNIIILIIIINKLANSEEVYSTFKNKFFEFVRIYRTE